MENKTPKKKFNIEDFSYKSKSIEDYFSEQYISRWSFNKQIMIDLIERKYVKLLPEDRQLAFVKFDKSQQIQDRSFFPLFIKPIEFFNLFYHELDFIIANKSKPLTIVPRLKQIRMYFHDMLYFYLKLMEVLKSENEQQSTFIASEIEDRYNRIFLIHLKIINNAKKTALKTITQYNEQLDSIGNVKEKLSFLFKYKNLNHKFHSDKDIDAYIRKHWLTPNIEHWQEHLTIGIEEVPATTSQNLQKSAEILNETDTTTTLEKQIVNRKESNIDKDPQINIPAKFYALYHWILIEMGLEKNFTCNESDKYIRKDIENFVINKYPQTSPQGFYRAYIEIDITNKKAIVNNFGNKYKEHIIKISNNNTRIIDHLKRYPN